MPLLTVYIPLRSVILLFKQTLKAPPPPSLVWLERELKSDIPKNSPKKIMLLVIIIEQILHAPWLSSFRNITTVGKCYLN